LYLSTAILVLICFWYCFNHLYFTNR